MWGWRFSSASRMLTQYALTRAWVQALVLCRTGHGDLTAQEIEARGSEVQEHPCLHGQFKASLCYIHLKKQQQTEGWRKKESCPNCSLDIVAHRSETSAILQNIPLSTKGAHYFFHKTRVTWHKAKQWHAYTPSLLCRTCTHWWEHCTGDQGRMEGESWVLRKEQGDCQASPHSVTDTPDQGGPFVMRKTESEVTGMSLGSHTMPIAECETSWSVSHLGSVFLGNDKHCNRDEDNP